MFNSEMLTFDRQKNVKIYFNQASVFLRCSGICFPDLIAPGYKKPVTCRLDRILQYFQLAPGVSSGNQETN